MKERIITLALAAAVTIGIAPAFAQVSEDAASFTNSDGVIADCMIQQKKRCYKRTYKKCAKKVKKVAAKPAPKTIVKEVTKTIEKPAVVQQPAAEQTVAAAAPVCSEQPVIIDRFEKRHRSLIHLGLFPFSLFGQ